MPRLCDDAIAHYLSNDLPLFEYSGPFALFLRRGFPADRFESRDLAQRILLHPNAPRGQPPPSSLPHALRPFRRASIGIG